jgi:hypothetical protein
MGSCPYETIAADGHDRGRAKGGHVTVVTVNAGIMTT